MNSPQDPVQDDRVDFHEEEEWSAVERDRDGGLVVGRDGEIGSVRAGDWLARRGEHVIVRRRRRWRQNGFEWAAGRRVAPVVARRWRVRLYLPGWRNARAEFQSVTSALDRAGYWFEGKTAHAEVRRSDQSVLWVAAGDAVEASRLICSEISQDPERLPPPPLTLNHAGIGIAHDPARGESLGRLICATVVTAGDYHGGLTVENRWRRACEAFGLVANRPWRHTGAVDPYEVWETLEHASS